MAAVEPIGFRGPGRPRYPEGAARFGYATRHVRCDCCLRDYLPQHVHRAGRWWWICGNCECSTPRRYGYRRGGGIGMLAELPCRVRYHFDRLKLPEPVPA